MTADVTREPTGGQELREAIRTRIGQYGGVIHDPGAAADAVLALPELAALLADADNWRRATTGDPTQPEPLAMQARTLLARVRELEATVTRVRKIHRPIDHEGYPASEKGDLSYCYGCGFVWPCPTARALDGEPQP